MITGTYCNNELWKYEMKSKRWTLLTTRGIAPSPRCYQSAVLYNDQMIIFGGECGYANIDFDDCYKFDFILDHWKEVKTSKPPLRRYRHIAVLSNNQMYIFGGRNIGMNTVLNDIHALCIGDPIVGTNLWNMCREKNFFDLVFLYQ
jgi:N-acetylneuraminic acid mutarotase